MKKDELVEVARRELGLSQAQAQAETVLVLREHIRSHRAEVRCQQVLSTSPDAQTPRGLQRMSHSELAQECSRRGIEIPAGYSNRVQATRAQMIILTQAAGGDWQREEDGLADL